MKGSFFVFLNNQVNKMEDSKKKETKKSKTKRKKKRKNEETEKKGSSPEKKFKKGYLFSNGGRNEK